MIEPQVDTEKFFSTPPELRGEAWSCKACCQSNAGWALECGRCSKRNTDLRPEFLIPEYEARPYVYKPDINIDWKLVQGAVKVFHREGSPWVEIEVPEGAICIWALTGAVHPVTESGAVTDDPIKLPFPNT